MKLLIQQQRIYWRYILLKIAESKNILIIAIKQINKQNYGNLTMNSCQQWKLSKKQQLRLENRTMQRPPRPLIKSAQLFPFSQIRKVLTPDCPHPQAEAVPALPEQQIKSMRDASATTDMHRSLNQVENVEYLEISKASNVANSKNNTNILSGCSFKIRNFTYSKSRGIKQNSIPLKSTHKPSSSSINANSSVRCIDIQHIEQIKLKTCPHTLELASVGSKIAYHKLSPITDQVKLFDEWAVIISQSLFSGSFLQEINLMKLKSLVENCKKYHIGINIILRLHSDRSVGDVISKISEKTISIDYVIWGKHKYFQTVNAFDITEIVKHKKINKYIVMEDTHEVIKNLYYLCQEPQTQNYNDDKTKQNKQLDFKSKFTYLKFNGLSALMKFAQNFRVSISEDQIIAQKRGYIQDTQSLFCLKQLREKIRIAEQRKNLKTVKQLERRISDQKSFKNSCDLSSKQFQLDKNQQFKKKIIQYAKILQEQHKITDGRSKSIDKKDTQKSEIVKGGPLKLVTQRAETPSTSKSSHQLVGQLLKNNALIHKQILKYQQKTAKVNIQLNQHYI